MRKKRWERAACVAAALVVWAALGGARSSAATEENVGSGSAAVVEDAAERGVWRKAFAKRRFPWFSSADDAVVFLPPRPVPSAGDVPVPTALEIPKPSPREVLNPSEIKSAFDLRFAARVVFWTLFGLLILASVVAICWTLAKAARDAREQKKAKSARGDRTRRLEAIAPEARDRFDDLGTAAENALAAGDLRLALVYFFSQLIVESDKRGFLRARRGKTNREYWLELRSNIRVRTIYKATMDAFERVYFGGRSISRAEFDDVWRLREAFLEITAAFDERRAAAERAARGAKRRTVRPFGGNSENNGSGDDGGNGAISRIWALPLATAALGVAASTGCVFEPTYWNESRFAEYASPSGGEKSVDGVSVFAEYCARKTRGVDRKWGKAVDARRYETIVWFYPERGVLDATESGGETRLVPFCDGAFERARPAVEDWLREKSGRTFVFVPDGWRADVDFWRAVREKVPEDDENAAWVARMLAAAERARREPPRVRRSELGDVWASANAADSKNGENGENGEDNENRENKEKDENETVWATWGALDETERRERLSGVDAWTAGLPTAFEYWTARTTTPGVGTETLLAVDGEPLVCRRNVGESEFFALDSAVFLLNFSTTKPENRVLAGRLAAEFAPKGKTLFWFGDELTFDDEEDEPVSPLSLARPTPFSLTVWRLTALAAVLVAWLFPIFGRPKRNVRETTNDFAKHVEAVAFLLEKAEARDWARNELETFRAAREAGAAFREPCVDESEKKDEIDGNGESVSSESAASGKKRAGSGRGASRKFFRR